MGDIMGKKISSKKSLAFYIIVLLLPLLIIILLKYYSQEVKFYDDSNLSEIKNHYSTKVLTNKDSDIYLFENNNYINVGSVSEGTFLNLSEQSISSDTKYFLITNMDDNYYIEYQNVTPTNNTNEENIRYKNYIAFNENIVGNNVNLYKDDKLLYSLKKEISLPIYIKTDDKYYVEYTNELLWVYKEDVEVIEIYNTDKKNTDGIGVLNYHFFWDDETESESVCDNEICHTKKQFEEHLSYIKTNNFFTPTMEELELYIDGKLQLPKSIVITIDDGYRMELGLKMLEEYNLNATVFLITSWFENMNFTNNYEYIEFHSHGENLHNQGVCPGGQGGAIKCLPKMELLEDLAKSREKLGGSTVFCYPFYEYNNYSIEILKKAGFTMAFAGETYNSDNMIKVGSDKYRLPRFVVVDYTTMEDFIKYVNQ